MRSRFREPTALELALWHHAVRGVVRLVEREEDRREQQREEATPSEPVPLRPPGEAPDAPGAAPRPVAARRSPPTAAPRPSSLDRRTLRQLERGRAPIAARLDLHGYHQEAAHAALTAFLARAQDRGQRCVLVITGRGERRGGVLRQSVPRWLQEPPLASRVLGFGEAGRAHGGAGALYVLLRRPRSEKGRAGFRSRPEPDR